MSTRNNNIKRIRKLKGITQGSVAKLLGISSPAFSKIETGVADLSVRRLERLAAILNVNILDLIQIDSDPHHNDLAGSLNEIKRLEGLISEQDNELISLQAKIISLYENALRRW